MIFILHQQRLRRQSSDATKIEKAPEHRHSPNITEGITKTAAPDLQDQEG
jgi:hypothetical protein